jgi:hypothetical protein
MGWFSLPSLLLSPASRRCFRPERLKPPRLAPLPAFCAPGGGRALPWVYARYGYTSIPRFLSEVYSNFLECASILPTVSDKSGNTWDGEKYKYLHYFSMKFFKNRKLSSKNCQT